MVNVEINVFEKFVELVCKVILVMIGGYGLVFE